MARTRRTTTGVELLRSTRSSRCTRLEAGRRIAPCVYVRALLLVAIAGLVVGCTSLPPAMPPASSPSPPAASASAATSAELRQAECDLLAAELADANQLQRLSVPFSADDRALVTAIYGRTNAGLARISALVEEASRSGGLSDSLTEAYLSLTSVASQLSTASIAVEPALRPAVHPGSPDHVIADLALAIQTIGLANQELGCR